MSHKRSHAPRWWENKRHSDSDGEWETVRTIASDEESLSDSEDREKGDEAAENSAEAPKELGVPRETDIFIACMGVTGSGKSSFISKCCGQQVKVGHELNSCTSVVEVFPFELSPGQTVYLIDTPGFDDTERSDTDVLRAIAHWLNESYKNKVLLRGIIYFHRILDVRMQGSAKKNILMFKKLCGNDALRNVALVTSMWDKVPKPEAEARERQLVETPQFWGFMVSKGSMALRHDNTAASALAVVRRLVDGGGPPVKLDVQDEMIDRRKLLDQTEAWQELEAAKMEQRKRWDAEKRELEAQVREEMREALRAKDEQSLRELREMKDEYAREHARRLAKMDEERVRARVDAATLHRQRMGEMGGSWRNPSSSSSSSSSSSTAVTPMRMPMPVPMPLTMAPSPPVSVGSSPGQPAYGETNIASQNPVSYSLCRVTHSSGAWVEVQQLSIQRGPSQNQPPAGPGPGFQFPTFPNIQFPTLPGFPAFGHRPPGTSQPGPPPRQSPPSHAGYSPQYPPVHQPGRPLVHRPANIPGPPPHGRWVNMPPPSNGSNY